jgi:hypothetical protein
MLAAMFPTVVSWETVECEKPGTVTVLDTLSTWHLLQYPVPSTLIFCLASEWHNYTSHVSIDLRLRNPSLTGLLIYTDRRGFNG